MGYILLNTRPAGRGQGPIKTQQCGFVQQEVFPEVPFGELSHAG